jgi:L-lactate dehydrogenase (cytochrome)
MDTILASPTANFKVTSPGAYGHSAGRVLHPQYPFLRFHSVAYREGWADVEWVKKLWGGKLILKGIMDVEDARLAADSGADALIVSNHGGRQLDGAPSSISALLRSHARSGSASRLDGGIRSGQDVLKAVALGAKGTLIGRSFLYGLGAMGEAGVTKCLEIIHKELDTTMAFCGHTDIRPVDERILLPDRR